MDLIGFAAPERRHFHEPVPLKRNSSSKTYFPFLPDSTFASFSTQAKRASIQTCRRKRADRTEQRPPWLLASVFGALSLFLKWTEEAILTDWTKAALLTSSPSLLPETSADCRRSPGNSKRQLNRKFRGRDFCRPIGGSSSRGLFLRSISRPRGTSSSASPNPSSPTTAAG
ncbi:hypothetical protein ACLOJK_007986 [Asimina triloba]